MAKVYRICLSPHIGFPGIGTRFTPAAGLFFTTKGSKLPSERELSELLGVSRSLLREAIMVQHLEDSIQKLEKLSEKESFPFDYKRTLTQ